MSDSECPHHSKSPREESRSDECCTCWVGEPKLATAPPTDRDLLQRAAEALRSSGKQCRCGGTGRYEPSCPYCHDSTWDHECPDEKDCDASWCRQGRDTLSAIEARLKEKP